jgi:hypothetical protein
MHYFMLFRYQIVYLNRIHAYAFYRSSGSDGIVNRPVVVMSKLDNQEISPLHLFQNRLPTAIRQESSATSAAYRMVFDMDFARIKMLPNYASPAPHIIFSFALASLYGAVAYEVEGGFGLWGEGENESYYEWKDKS